MENKQEEHVNLLGRGAVQCTLPLFFLPFTQNNLEAPIPENYWPCKPFCCGCPYEKKTLWNVGSKKHISVQSYLFELTGQTVFKDIWLKKIHPRLIEWLMEKKQKEHVNPLGRGAVQCTLPLVFLPFTQNYLEAPIPENSWPCKPFCCGCPYEEKKSRNLVLPPSQSILKYGSGNRPWVRG